MKTALRFSALLLLASTSLCGAQVNADALYSVVKLRIGTHVCSGFRMAVASRHYLITARHCGLARSSRTEFELWRDDRWSRHEALVILPEHQDVDIAALDVTGLEVGDRRLEAGTEVFLGQQVYFLGFPSDLATRGRVPAPPGFGELPFIKSGVLSAIDARTVGARLYYVDGQNNRGFSGGPIVFMPPKGGLLQVVAVVSSYRYEVVPVVKREHLADQSAVAHDDLYVRNNTGIVIGYAVRHIVDAIERKTAPPKR